jgi:hypothetical protein
VAASPTSSWPPLRTILRRARGCLSLSLPGPLHALVRARPWLEVVTLALGRSSPRPPKLAQPKSHDGENLAGAQGSRRNKSPPAPDPSQRSSCPPLAGSRRAHPSNGSAGAPMMARTLLGHQEPPKSEAMFGPSSPAASSAPARPWPVLHLAGAKLTCSRQSLCVVNDQPVGNPKRKV